MNTGDSSANIRKFVDELVAATQDEIAAAAQVNTPQVNRCATRVWRRLEALKASAAGRAELEALTEHAMPEIRLRAAQAVLEWAPDKAIPVLGHLLAEWRPANPKKGYVPVAFSASVSLFKHFKLHSYDEDDLVEPLRRYGIELEHRERGQQE